MTISRSDLEYVADAMQSVKPERKEYKEDIEYVAAMNAWIRCVEQLSHSFGLMNPRFNPSAWEKRCGLV